MNHFTWYIASNATILPRRKLSSSMLAHCRIFASNQNAQTLKFPSLPPHKIVLFCNFLFFLSISSGTGDFELHGISSFLESLLEIILSFLKTYFLLFFNATKSRNSRLQMFFRIGVLKNFANFRGKQVCRPATLLKRDSNTRVFLWNLWNF